MRNKERPEGADLAELARRQHGVVSIRQLGRLGWKRSSVTKAVRARRLHRLHRGVYAVGHTDLSWHAHCLAAVLANSPAAVASHFSAGWLWGLLSSQPSGRFNLTAPTRRHPKAGFAIHHAALADRDRTIVDGVPVTSLARTQLDLAARSSRPVTERRLERAEELEVFDLRALDDVLERCGHHPGAGRLRAALAIYRPDPAMTRSRVERRFRNLMKQAGLPPPSMNFVVGGYELDAYWEPERFVVELDLYETHGTRAAFERDRLRQEELKLIGIEMIRVTGPRLQREPGAVAERIGTLLGGGGGEVGPPAHR
jgi:predicted transcriptional regulator of viral defense system